MFGPKGERLDFGDGKRRGKMVRTLPRLFNTQPVNPVLLNGNGEPVYLGATNEGGTTITKRQRTAAARTRKKRRKMLRAQDRVI